MAKRIRKVLIVGGGTAGWLTAGILARKLNCDNSDAVQITLVESPTIPILGVGEGTWPTIRTTLQTIGIDETDFIRECDATFKQGSEFVNWVHTPAPSELNSYYHPLSAVFHSAYDFNLAPYWLLGREDGLGSYDEITSSQAHICNKNLAPKKITTPAYAAIQNYSYHLDANKFAQYLHRFCVENLGVDYRSANVIDVAQDEQGYISAIQTDEQGVIEADFFVDCSGAKGVLINGALEVGYREVRDVVFNDSAMAMQVPYDDADDPIATHTIATAFEHGWSWDIGLSERRGVGYVYSGDYCSDEQAEQSLRNYVGDASDQLECRKLRFRSGYRTKFWHKNCLAIGMSGAFIEPLEASAIFLVEAAVNMLAEQFPRTREDMHYVAKQYNSIYQMRWDKTIDFVKLHYCISKRRDSQYWIDNCRPESIPDSLAEKLDFWKTHVPSKYDFDNAFEPFVLDSYLFVLYGMEYDVDLSASRTMFTRNKEAQRKFAEINKTVEKLVLQLPSQRKLIQQLRTNRFSAI